MNEQAVHGGWERRAWIVEDEPAAATLAVELCEASGAAASVFRLPLPFLTALRGMPGPTVAMIQDDRYTVIVDKAAGTTSFEEALSWALDPESASEPC